MDPLGLLGKTEIEPADPLGLLREPAMSLPTTGQKIARAAAPYARPALEFGGMAMGVLGGTPVGPLGNVTGGAIGYAAGRQAADLLEEYAGMKTPEGMAGRFRRVGEDLPAGAMMEMGGQVLGKGIQAAAKAIAESKLPQRLYGSATKMPLSKKWTEVLPGHKVSERQKAIKVGLEHQIPPSEFGLAKVTRLEQEARQAVDDIIQAGATRGDVVRREDLLTRGLERAYRRAARSSDPVGAKQIVDDVAEKFRAHPEEIPTNTLNQIKRQIYDEVKWGGAEQTAIASQLKTMGKKGIAHEAMVKLEELYPAVAALNKKDGAFIALKEAIERATGRMQNKDIIDLSSKVLAVNNLPLAVANWTLGTPFVKSRLAFALSKSQHLRGKVAGRIASYESQKSTSPSPTGAEGLVLQPQGGR